MTIGPLGIAYSGEFGKMPAIVSADTFAAHLFHAQQGDDQIAAMTSTFDHNRDETDTTFVLTVDGKSGFAVRPDGELVYLFSTARGRGNMLVGQAIGYGATNLDCFEGYLVDLYARHGFQFVKRESNWDPEGPDVIWMRLV